MKKGIIISTIILIGMLSNCSKKRYPDLGNGYRFETVDGNSLAIVNFENTIIIGTEILDFAFDSTYILVSHRPWDVPNIAGLKDMTYNQRNEAFENSKFIQYWIINKKENSIYNLDSMSQTAKYSNVYGPFQKEEYIKKCMDLGVPKILKIKE